MRAKDSNDVTSEVAGEDTHSNAEPEEQIDQLLPELDYHLFIFYTALIQHKVTKVYDSAIISFLAARSLSPATRITPSHFVPRLRSPVY